MPDLPVLVLSSPLRGHTDLLLDQVISEFAQKSGVELRPESAEKVKGEPLPALLHLTGGTEHLALAVAVGTAAPLLLLAHRSHNSLPAALETLARLQEDGRKAWLVLSDSAEELHLFAQAADLARRLRGKRVGLLGGVSPWLVASSPDPDVLRTRLGLEFVEVPLSLLNEGIPPPAGSLPGGIGVGVGEKERTMASRVYAGLKALAEELKLSALSVACFSLLSEERTACWALARLSDEGIPGGCEGDLPGLLALWLSRLLTGQPGFLANPAEVDLKGERVLLAHCTVPLSLVESFELRTHFESGIGLAVAGRLRPGPYTLMRFGGKELEKAFIVEGSVLPEHPGREDLCRTQVWFKMPKGAIQKLLREPLGNHHVLIPGHHRLVLSLFHQIFLAG